MSARPGKTGVCLREQSRSPSNCTREDLWTPCSTSLPPPRTKQNIGVGWGGLGGSTMSGGARAFQGAYDSIRNRPHHALSSDVWIVVVTPRCSMHFLASGCRRTEWNEVSSAETSFLSLFLTHTITGSYAKL